MSTVNLSPAFGVAAQVFNNNGVPLAGGKIYTYAAGTSTPVTTYTSLGASIAHSNPIILDSAGRVPAGGEIWIVSGSSYKFVLKTSDEVLIGSWDNVSGSVTDANNLSYTPDSASLLAPGPLFVNVALDTISNEENGSAYVGFIQSGTNAVARTVKSKISEVISVADFGAVGDGVTDEADSIQAAIDFATSIGGGRVILPAGETGVYLINSQISVKSNVILDGQFNTIKIQDWAGCVNIVNADNVLVENLVINGNAINRTEGVGVYAIYPFTSMNSTNVTVRKCTCYDMEFAGFSANQGPLAGQYNTNVTVENCVFYDCGTAAKPWSYGNGIAATGCEDFFVSDNLVYDVAGVGGINLEGILQKNVVISGNRIYNMTGPYGMAAIKAYAGGVDQAGTNVVIRDNFISNVANTCSAAIWIQQGDTVVISNNVIYDSPLGSIVSLSCQNSLVIDGNTIKNSVLSGYTVNTAANFRITNNTLICPNTAVNVNYANRFYIETQVEATSQSSAIISNNTLINCPGEAVTFACRSPIIFTQNVIQNCRAATGVSQGYGINYLVVDFNQSIFGNNLIIDTIGSYNTRFYGFYNFEGSNATDLVYLADAWRCNGNNMPRYWLYNYNGFIRSSEPIVASYPVSGNPVVGDIVWNSSAASGGNAGWICVDATTPPGTWKTFGTIS